MSKKNLIILAVVVAVIGLFTVGACTGVVTPDTSAPTYGNPSGGGGS